MATRSVVFVGDSLGVYSHWDGYPSAMIPAILKMREEFPSLTSLEDEVVTKTPAGWAEFGTRRLVPAPGEEPMNQMHRKGIPGWVDFSYFVTEDGIAFREGGRRLKRLTWEQAEREFGK